MSKCSTFLFLLIILALTVDIFAQYDPNHFDSDNAAHWYRKAFALYEEPNDIDLDSYIDGEIELTPEIEQFIKAHQSVVDLVTKAAQIKHCDWEFDPLAGGTYTPAPYFSGVRKVTQLLLADAHFEEKEEQQNNTFKNYEIVLLVASHVDAEMLLDHLVAIAIRTQTYNAILEYLDRYPNCRLRNLYKIDTLLRNESNRSKITLKDTINGEIEYTTQILTNYKTFIYNDTYLSRFWGIPFKKLSADFYKNNLKYYKEYMTTLQSYLDSPYPQAVHQILDQREILKQKFRAYFVNYKQVLDEKLDSLMFNDSLLADVDIHDIEGCDFLCTVTSTTSFVNMLSLDTRVRTQLNVLQAGTKILIKSRGTKKIPERIPFNYPNDLFSDKPFLIIKTEAGFKLKCQGEDLGQKNKIHEYEFKLPTK